MGEVVRPVAGSLLSFLDDAARARILGTGVRRSFGANELLHREGDPSTHVLILTSGWVRVSTSSRDGREILLALRGPGDVLGELAALHGWPRSASVSTVEPATVVQFTGPQFVSAVNLDRDFSMAVIRTTAVRLRDAEGARVDSATLDVGKRVASWLLRLTIAHGERAADGIRIRMPLSQEDIANRVGASRRAVARSLALLRERGIVRTARRSIIVIDPGVLRALADCGPH